MTIIFLTVGTTTWTVPADWNNLDNSIETIAAGGDGQTNVGSSAHNIGGGGGAYSRRENFVAVVGSVKSVVVGSGGLGDGGDTYFNGTSLGTCFVGAQGGKSGANGGLGGSSTFGIGTIRISGGNGGINSGSSTFGGGTGGGGAAGPNGGGTNGGTVTGVNHGGSGGGAGSGGGDGITGGFNAGGNGGVAFDTTAGGLGGASVGLPGANGLHGSGGGGGAVDFGGSTTQRGGNGGGGIEFDSTHGAGGGGGGGGDLARGGDGGLYGGGGGANGAGGSIGGSGAPGLIIITYSSTTPTVSIPVLFWDEAEAALQLYIKEQWISTAYATTVKLVFENEIVDSQDIYMVINIEGTFPEKGPYGSTGTHLYVEHGIIFYHCFAPMGQGKQAALGPIRALQTILELKTVSDMIKIEGGNPPSAAEQSDNLLPNRQPGGNYYRVSGSVPFFLIGS